MEINTGNGNRQYKTYTKKYTRENFLTYKQFYYAFKAINFNKIKAEYVKSIANNLARSQILDVTHYTDTRIIDEIMAIKEAKRDFIGGNHKNYTTTSSDIASEKNMKKALKIRKRYPTEIRASDKIKPVKPINDYMERIPEKISEILPKKSNDVINKLLDSGKLILAGGFVSGVIFGTPSKDIDLFLTTQTELSDLTQLIDSFRLDDTILYSDGACIKIWNKKYKVDIVMVVHESAHNLITSFDLSCSMFAYSKNRLYYNTYSMYTVCTGGILANNIRFLHRSPVRLVKYLKRGFSLHLPFDPKNLLDLKNCKFMFMEWISPTYVKEEGYIWYKVYKYTTTESINLVSINDYQNTDDFAQDYQLPIFYYGKNLGKWVVPKMDKKLIRMRFYEFDDKSSCKNMDIYFGKLTMNKFIPENGDGPRLADGEYELGHLSEAKQELCIAFNKYLSQL